MKQKIRVVVKLEGVGIDPEKLEADLQRFIDEDTRESIQTLSNNEITITDVSDQ